MMSSMTDAGPASRCSVKRLASDADLSLGDCIAPYCSTFLDDADFIFPTPSDFRALKSGLTAAEASVANLFDGAPATKSAKRQRHEQHRELAVATSALIAHPDCKGAIARLGATGASPSSAAPNSAVLHGARGTSDDSMHLLAIGEMFKALSGALSSCGSSGTAAASSLARARALSGANGLCDDDEEETAAGFVSSNDDDNNSLSRSSSTSSFCLSDYPQARLNGGRSSGDGASAVVVAGDAASAALAAAAAGRTVAVTGVLRGDAFAPPPTYAPEAARPPVRRRRKPLKVGDAFPPPQGDTLLSEGNDPEHARALKRERARIAQRRAQMRADFEKNEEIYAVAARLEAEVANARR